MHYDLAFGCHTQPRTAIKAGRRGGGRREGGRASRRECADIGGQREKDVVARVHRLTFIAVLPTGVRGKYF